MHIQFYFKNGGGGGGGGGGSSAATTTQGTGRASGLTPTQQQQYEALIKKTQGISEDTRTKLKSDAQRDIQRVNQQIQNYQTRIGELQSQVNWGQEQSRAFMFRTGTRPMTGARARDQIKDREQKIATLESGKKVLQLWLGQQ